MAKRKASSKAASGSSMGSEIVGRLRRFTEDLSRTGKLTGRFNVRTIQLNLKSKPYDAELVKRTRATLGASQAVFARFIGVSLSAVHDWEQGLKSPRGSACRLMDEIRQNPNYWLERLRELAHPVTSK